MASRGTKRKRQPVEEEEEEDYGSGVVEVKQATAAMEDVAEIDDFAADEPDGKDEKQSITNSSLSASSTDVCDPLVPWRQVMRLAVAGRNVFVSGAAGHGKTELLLRVASLLRGVGKHRNVVVLASGTRTAQLLNAMTAHKWVGHRLAKQDGQTLAALTNDNPALKRQWRDAQVLIIDAIESLDVNLWNRMDAIGRHVRNRPKLPFGGLQVIVGGDFYGLPPVTTKTASKDGHLFATAAWEELELQYVELVHNFRQRDQAYFASILRRFRVGQPSSVDVEWLESRVTKVPDDGTLAIAVRGSKNEVDDDNNQMASVLTTREVFAFDSQLRLDPDASRRAGMDATTLQAHQRNLHRLFPGSKSLELRIGMQVRLTADIPEHQLRTSMCGVVVGVTTDPSSLYSHPIVRFMPPASTSTVEVAVKPHVFERWDNRVGLVQCTKVPLEPGFSTTVWAVQGLTLTRAVVSLGKNMRGLGVAYTAVSRVPGPEHLFLQHLDAAVFTRPKPDAVATFYATLSVSTERVAMTPEQDKAIEVHLAARPRANTAPWTTPTDIAPPPLAPARPTTLSIQDIQQQKMAAKRQKLDAVRRRQVDLQGQL